MAVRDLCVCVSSCDAPPWIRFAGDGIWGRGKLLSTCGLLSSSPPLSELISSHTIRHDPRLSALRIAKRRAEMKVYSTFIMEKRKRGCVVCVWMYEQEGRLDDTTRELMLQGFR
jgi:hypothetical protein